MKKVIPFVLGLSFAVGGSVFTAAQNQTATMPKVLQIQREYLKPGKAGAIHDKSESAFVEAAMKAKWSSHYIALNSMSGRSRALYIAGYDSFAEMQKANDEVDKNPTLAAAIERASIADGELLQDYGSEILTYREDLSFRPRPDLSNQKYLEIISYHIRPGRAKEWMDETKALIEAHKKADTNANWAMFHMEYGGDENVYVAFSLDTGLDEIDTGDVMSKKLHDVMGDEGMKKMAEVNERCVQSSGAEIFSINPKQSYAPDEWVKANPSFWKPKAMMNASTSPAAATKKNVAVDMKPAH